MPGKAGTIQFPGYRSSEGLPQAFTFHLADAQESNEVLSEKQTSVSSNCWKQITLEIQTTSIQALFPAAKPWQGDTARAEPQPTWQGMLDALNRADTQCTQAGSPRLNPETKIHIKLKGMEEGGMKWDIGTNPAF